MNPSEAKLIRILTITPKHWRELLPDFPARCELNDALLQCEKRGEIIWKLQDGLYHVTKAPRIAQDARKTSVGMDVPPSEENAAQTKGDAL